MGGKPIGGIFSVGVEERVPLEGLGAERRRDPHLGRRRHRQRPAAVVHEVRRRRARPSAGWTWSRTFTAGTTGASATSATRCRWPAWRWCTRSRPRSSTAAPRRRQKVEDHTRCVSGAGRGADSVRDGARPAARRRSVSSRSRRSSCRTSPRSRTRSASSSARSSRAAAASSRRTRRRCTTSGACARTDFGLARPVRGHVDRRASRSRCRTPTSGSRTIRARAGGTPSSRPRRRAGGSSTAYAGWTSGHGRRPHRAAADARSRPIRTCRWRRSTRASRRPTSPRSSSARSARGRVVYFPWDIDRTFWEVLAADHGRLLRNAVRVGDRDEPPVDGHGPGRRST